MLTDSSGSGFRIVVVPEGKIGGGHSGGIQNMPRPSMAAYGNKSLQCRDFCNFTMA